MEQYILAIDQSTAATKAILFTRKADVAGRYDTAHKQYYPKPGWVEHDAEEIYRNTITSVGELMRRQKITWDQIAAVSISNQRETVVVWDKETGKPVCNAIVWQCARAVDICAGLERNGMSEEIRRKTGLMLSPYFSAPKVSWILKHVDGVKKKAEDGKILMGTIDSYLIWKLTGGKVHATDYSNASRTSLLNLYTLKWDEELLEAFDIPLCMMPEIGYSDDIFGETDFEGIASKKIPISGVMGDSHGALFAQNCYRKGMAKATYGTGSSVMMNIGDKPSYSDKGIVTSIAWGMDKRVEYVFEGNINYSGATIKWLAEDLQLIKSAKESGQTALSVPDNNGVYLVPSFTGMGAPYWDTDARAIICGLTNNAKKAHIVRAAEESIAYRIKDILDLMTAEADVVLNELRADGGATADKFLMQFQADIPLIRKNFPHSERHIWRVLPREYGKTRMNLWGLGAEAKFINAVLMTIRGCYYIMDGKELLKERG